MSGEISFSPWISWFNRNNLAGKGKADVGGVYLFARFEYEPPSGPVEPSEKRIVYIGQSSRQTFKGRWDPLERYLKANKGKGRAKRYGDLFGDDLSHLYVSTLPYADLLRAFLKIAPCSFLDINCGNIATVMTDEFKFIDVDDLLIKYVERRLILLYALRHGYRPVLNID